MTRYNVLAIVAVITVPLAPAILFGWNLYNYLMGKGVPVWLAIVGGVAGAVSLEAVGILAGHVGMVYLKRRDWRVLFPAIAMLFYAGYGYVKTPEYGGVFILAALVYVLVALQGEADTAVKQELADTAVHLAFDLEQEAADREHAREMEAKQLELQAQNDLQIKIAHEQAQASIAVAEAKAQASIANAEARKVLALAKPEPAVAVIEPAVASYVCEDCGQSFATVQALNAHGRAHRKRVPVNGNGIAKG